MKTIKINVSVEIPEDLFCSLGAGQYDNMIDCSFCDWDEDKGRDYCNLFGDWLEQVNGHFKDSIPCKQCLEARNKEWLKQINYGGLSWFGKMKLIGKKIGGVIASIRIWKKRSS